MATGSGISGQLGVAEESTWGTAVTVTRFYELLDENIDLDIARIESEGIRSGQRVLRSDDWVGGTKRVTGPITLELATKNIALLFKHALGSVVTTGAGPYTHTISPGDLTGKGLTVQAGRPSDDGTVQPFTWNGVKILDWELSFEVNKHVKLVFTVVAKDQTTATALASASYTSGLQLLSFVHGAITIGGSAAKVKSGSIKGVNAFNLDRIFTGDSTISEPLENGRRQYSFDLKCEFESLTALNRIVNGTEAALSLAFTRGSDSVTVAGNIRSDKGMPNLANMDVLEQPLSGKFVATAADSTALTVTVVSGESTP
ncbi:MAG TPA: phage tail tube protein [Acidimicrobiales bacterium]|nr:phage tail tube protein [Acidimicrobiales bacterium]